LLVRSYNDENLRNYYLKYKILAKIIKTAKKFYYNNKIIHAHNKIKGTWNVIKSDMGIHNDKYGKRNVNKNCEDSPSKINAENFNDHFPKIAENISDKIKNNKSLNINGTTYSPCNLPQIFKLKYDNIRFHSTSTGEIEKKKHKKRSLEKRIWL
jgi:hypothetical protein